VIETAADIELARSLDVYGSLFGIRIHPPLDGDLGNLQVWYDLGVRVFQIADPRVPDELGERLGGGQGQSGGLTALGRAALDEIIRLGMVVDFPHSNEQTTLETAAVALEKGVPVMANHAPVYAMRRFQVGSTTERDDRFNGGKTDAELTAIANTGGVVAILCYGPWLTQLAGDLATVEDCVLHLDHAVGLIGVDHVGVATDAWMDGQWTNDEVSGDGVLDGRDRWRAVVTRLWQMGYSTADLEKIMGLNLLRVYQRVLK